MVSLRCSTFLLLVSLLYLGITGSAVHAQSSTPWKMFRQNPAHTGLSPLAGPRFPDAAWSYTTTGYTYSSPAIDTDRLFITSDEQLISLNLDGTMRWSVNLSGSAIIEGIEVSGIVSSPAVDDNGVIYVGSLDNNLYAVGPDGVVDWSFDTGDQVFSSPNIGPDGTIYIGSLSGTLYAVNPDSTLNWERFIGGEIFSSPALNSDGTAIYVGSTNGTVSAFDLENSGLPLWNTGTLVTDEVVSSPAYGSNDVVYFASISGAVYAVNAQSGLPVWSQPYQTGSTIVSSPAIGADGTIYIGSFDGNLYALDGATGALRWSFNTGDVVAASPAIDSNGLIYIGSLNGMVYALNDNGTQASIRWTYETNSPVWASASVGPNNTLYIASSGTTVSPGSVQAIGEAIYEVGFVPTLPVAGEELTLSILLTNSQAPASGTLYYRSAGETSFTPAPFNGTIPIPNVDVTEDGFVYYIEGPEGTFPARLPQNRPATQSVFVSSAPSEASFAPRQYSMISVPFNLRDDDITAVLDEYGPYDPQIWRLLRWNGTDYQEFPNLDDTFSPGTAFFLVTRLGDRFSIEAGTSVNVSEPYAITLSPGWNQVGTPFGFPVAWADVPVDPNIVNGIAFFDGSEMVQDPTAIPTLLPWQGYFVHNASDNDVALSIPPVPANSTLSIEKQASSSLSRVQIIASIDGTGLRDSQNWVGFHSGPEMVSIPIQATRWIC